MDLEKRSKIDIDLSNYINSSSQPLEDIKHFAYLLGNLWKIYHTREDIKTMLILEGLKKQ